MISIFSEHNSFDVSFFILLYRILANQTSEDKRRFLLDGLSQLQLAVTEQEYVVLNVQRLIPSHEKVKPFISVMKSTQNSRETFHFSIQFPTLVAFVKTLISWECG